MKRLMTLVLILLCYVGMAQNGKRVGQVKIYPTPANQALNYYILSGNPSTAFKIDAKTGDVFVNNQAAIDAHGWVYSMQIRLRYSTNGVILRDSIVLFKTDARYAKLVNEIRIGPIPKDNLINFNIQAGNTGTAFEIDPKTGAIFIKNQAAVDAGAWRYMLTIRQRYSKDGVITGDVFKTIRILNFVKNQYIGTISYTDEDRNQSYTYKIMSGNYSTAFYINTKTGALYVSNPTAINAQIIAAMTYPTQYSSTYVLSIRVLDNGIPMASGYGTASILMFANVPTQDIFNCR